MKSFHGNLHTHCTSTSCINAKPKSIISSFSLQEYIFVFHTILVRAWVHSVGHVLSANPKGKATWFHKKCSQSNPRLEFYEADAHVREVEGAPNGLSKPYLLDLYDRRINLFVILEQDGHVLLELICRLQHNGTLPISQILQSDLFGSDSIYSPCR